MAQGTRLTASLFRSRYTAYGTRHTVYGVLNSHAVISMPAICHRSFVY